MIYVLMRRSPQIVIVAQPRRYLPKGLPVGRMNWAEKLSNGLECIVNIWYPGSPTHLVP
jgi:hypothetical protein